MGNLNYRLDVTLRKYTLDSETHFVAGVWKDCRPSVMVINYSLTLILRYQNSQTPSDNHDFLSPSRRHCQVRESQNDRPVTYPQPKVDPKSYSVDRHERYFRDLRNHRQDRSEPSWPFLRRSTFCHNRPLDQVLQPSYRPTNSTYHSSLTYGMTSLNPK